MLTAEQPFANHNGGQMLFGPDGMLYIGLGDGGGGGDPGGRGQSLADLLGAILRVDVRSGTGYTVPPDNPFVGQADARPEPSGATGSAIPGASASIARPATSTSPTSARTPGRRSMSSPAADGAGRGANFGWNSTEGRHCYVGGLRPQPVSRCPCSSTAHDEGCSISGGYVYRGAAIPALQGHYFYADYCSGWVRSFRLQDGQAMEPQQWPTLAPGGGVPSFGQDAAGELYVTERGGTGIPDRAAGSGGPRCPRRAAARVHVRFGASSWNYPGWRGLVYHRDYDGQGRVGQDAGGILGAFRSSGPSGSTPASMRRPPSAVLASYAEHLPAGFPVREQGVEPAHGADLQPGAGQGARRPGQSRIS